MKLKHYTAVFILCLCSCGKTKDSHKNPTISDFEVGENDSRTVSENEPLHVGALITAPGRIDKIEVKIHRKTDDKVADNFDFSDAKGKLNAHFHEDITHNLEHGEYILDFVVLDESGKKTSKEKSLTVTESTGDEGEHLHSH